MKAKIKKVYMGVPVPSWPKANFDINIDIEEIEKILADIELKSDLEVEFTDKSIVRTPEDVDKLKDNLKDVDGILAFNLSSGLYEIFSKIVGFGIPTVLFSQPYSGHDWSRVAQMRKEGKKVDVLATSDYNEIIGRLKLIEVIRKLKETKIIYIGNGGANPNYVRRIKNKFGTDVISVSSSYLREIYNSIDEQLANKEADKWINNALKVIEPTREEIVKSSKMYLAIKEILNERKANAITINCLGLFAKNALPAYPCFSFSKLNDEGMTGVCEADLDSTMTQLIMSYLAGKPGFVADPVIDTAKNVVIHAHCVSATKMDGPSGKSAPCIIRSHTEDNKGASLQVFMRVGQKVTVAKLINLETMLISIGKIVSNPESDRGCRTKIEVKVDNARKILDNWTGALHRVIFYGDYVEEVINLGKLLGVQVVKEG